MTRSISILHQIKKRLTFRFIKKYLKIPVFVFVILFAFYPIYKIAFKKNIKVIISYCVNSNNTENFNKYYTNEKLIENNEWEPLNEYFYVRAKGFYFKEDSIIRLLAISSSNMSSNLYSCYLELFQLYSNQYICVYIDIKHQRKSKTYSSYAIDCIIPSSLNLKTIEMVNVYLYDHQKQLRTKRPITVDLKLTETQATKIVDNIMLCSKQYNLTINEYENLKHWFEINRKLGYKKIVIYNNSIPNEMYNELIASYKGYIQVNEYKYLPHLYLLDSKNYTNGPYYYNLKELNTELRRIHENIALNECYCMNRYKFTKISVFDIDEVIIPPIVTSKHLSFNFTLDASCNNNIDMNEYVNGVKKHYYQATQHSYWFTYARMMTIEFTNSFMLELEIVLNRVNSSNANFSDIYVVNRVSNGSFRNIAFTIKDFKDYEHARLLLSAYKRILANDKEFFKVKNATRFHRILAVFLNYNYHQYGKSVHFTSHITSIGHHAVPDLNYQKVFYKSGFVSHFRNTFYYEFYHTIRSVFLDFNYYNCYLKIKKNTKN